MDDKRFILSKEEQNELIEKYKGKSLMDLNPELVKEWHPSKNGDLKPNMVTCDSNLKVWWLLPYDDPKTGKHFDFEWQDTINSRQKRYLNPFVEGRHIWKGFNDLETVNPELAKEWHPTKNGDLKPNMVTCGSGLKVWWFLPYDDPKTGNHFDFEWQNTISHRIQGINCPYLSGKAVWKGFNDLETVNPELAKEWHPTKNGDLKPNMVTCGSGLKVWWLLPYDDPKTGKHFDFEWQAKINNRKNGDNCPFISGKQIWKGFNDLETVDPKLAKEWHPIKNGDLRPNMVIANSGIKVWWFLPYDDPKTGKHFDFEWQATVDKRRNGSGCPYISNNKVWKGFNDLETTNPELAKEWHPTKNGDLKPSMVALNSHLKVWWFLPYDDPKTSKHFDFEWQALISNRNKNQGNPFISSHDVWKGFNDLETTNPELAKEWHPTKNGDLKPSMVALNSHLKVWWFLPYDDPKTGKHFDFEWQSTIYNRQKRRINPFVEGRHIWKGFNDLETTNPELAKEWHPTKNGDLKPSMVTAGSELKVWWLLPYDDPKTGKHFDFEWQAIIYSRKNSSCPYLKSSKTEVLLYEIMKKEKIAFTPEKTFENCKHKNLLPFDLFLDKHNIIIELDGIQHFESNDFFGGDESFKETNLRDNIKNDFCRENNICLLRIPYIYDPVVDKEKIAKMVLTFIKNKKIPKEIQKFYSQFEFSNYIKNDG